MASDKLEGTGSAPYVYLQKWTISICVSDNKIFPLFYLQNENARKTKLWLDEPWQFGAFTKRSTYNYKYVSLAVQKYLLMTWKQFPWM